MVSGLSEMDQLMHKFWKVFWQKHTGEEDWSEAFIRMIQRLPENVVSLGLITEDDIIHSALGCDLWAVDELRALPRSAIRALAAVYNHMEEHNGGWPGDMMEAFVALIPKVDSDGEPRNQRPVTLLPMLLRLWSSIRARALLGQVSGLLPSLLFGAECNTPITGPLFWHASSALKPTGLGKRECPTSSLS